MALKKTTVRRGRERRMSERADARLSMRVDAAAVVGPAFAGMIGYAPEEILGKTAFDFTSSEDRKQPQEKEEGPLKAGTTTYEASLLN